MDVADDDGTWAGGDLVHSWAIVAGQPVVAHDAAVPRDQRALSGRQIV